jgi:hypothetical protein
MTVDPLAKYVEAALPPGAMLREHEPGQNEPLDSFLDLIQRIWHLPLRLFWVKRAKTEVFIMMSDDACAIVLNERHHTITFEFFRLCFAYNNPTCIPRKEREEKARSFINSKMAEFFIDINQPGIGLLCLSNAIQLSKLVPGTGNGGAPRMSMADTLAVSFFGLAHEIGHLPLGEPYDRIRVDLRSDGVEIGHYVRRCMEESGSSHEEIAAELAQIDLRHIANEIAADVFACDAVFQDLLAYEGVDEAATVSALMRAFFAQLMAQQCRTYCELFSGRLSAADFITPRFLRSGWVSAVRAKFLMRRVGVNWLRSERGNVKFTDEDLGLYAKKVDQIAIVDSDFRNDIYMALHTVQGDLTIFARQYGGLQRLTELNENATALRGFVDSIIKDNTLYLVDRI